LSGGATEEEALAALEETSHFHWRRLLLLLLLLEESPSILPLASRAKKEVALALEETIHCRNSSETASASVLAWRLLEESPSILPWSGATEAALEIETNHYRLLHTFRRDGRFGPSITSSTSWTYFGRMVMVYE
jgi:hypothetical protein